MITRPQTMFLVTAVAVAGYCGAHRLGRWLDSPIVAVPAQPVSDTQVESEGEPARSLPWQRANAVATADE